MGGVRGRAWLPLRFPRVKDSSDKASGVADSGPASGSARAQSGAPVETKLGPQSWNELAETLKEVLTRLGPAAVLGFIAATLPPLGSIALFYYMNDLGAWLRGHGTQGLVYYALGFGLFAGLALLPTYASAALGGWAFGFANGFPAAMSGFVLGSLIGYAIARPTASSRVESLINEKPKWKTVRDSLVGSGFWRTLMIVTLVRVPPNSPFAVTNLVLASVRVPVVPYALGDIAGHGPADGGGAVGGLALAGADGEGCVEADTVVVDCGGDCAVADGAGGSGVDWESGVGASDESGEEGETG